ncbi:MAG TPA: hypothetical protein VFR97_11060 [Capillimicrobium sp.]|nr:hypothetical protein [Capillimicrobium sp.]
MRRRTAAAGAVLAAVLAAPAVAGAADGSLVYAKGGDVYLAAPDGSGERRLTTDGGKVLAVQQTDDAEGRHPRRLHVLSRDGGTVGAPIETVPVDNSFYIGPLAPAISPDGTKVVYHYFYTGPIEDETEPKVAYSRLDDPTVPGEWGNAFPGYLSPSWVDDQRTLLFFGAQRVAHVGVDTLDGPYSDWFGDPEVETLLTNGEVTRAGDRLVAIGERNDLRLYAVQGPIPGGDVSLACSVSGFAGDVKDPTWSPDGRSLAYADADGIHVMALPDLAGCASAKRTLVVRGGENPDWGPAAAPRAAATLRVGKASRQALLGKGLVVRVNGAPKGRVTLVARAGRTVVARGSAKAGAAGSATVRLKATKAGRTALAGAKRLVVSGAGAKVTVKLAG